MAAEVRCPMCGKSNPADAEVCQYCQARIKPVTPQSGAAGNASSDPNEPDWLRDLRADEPQGPSAADESESAADVPEWLSRIRQKTEETDQSAGLFNDDAASEDDPDWLKGFQSDASPTASFDDSDDWLSRIGEEKTAAQPPSQTGDDVDQAADLAGWLKGLDEADSSLNQPLETSQPTAEAADEQPSAWADLWADSSVPAAAVPDASEEAAPDANFDWLNSFNVDESPSVTDPIGNADSHLDEAAVPGAESPVAGWGMTDWLNSSKPDSQTSQNEGELPSAAASDWDALSDESAAPATQSQSEDLPDWLSAINEPETASEPQPPAAAQSDIPSWLMDEESPLDDAERTASALPAAAPQAGVPSWLMEDSSAPDASQAGDDLSADDQQGDVPAWLAGFAAVSASDQQSADQQPRDQSIQAADADLPDWLQPDVHGQPEAESQPVTPMPQIGEPGGDLPDWFSAVDEHADGQESALSVTEPSDIQPAEVGYGMFADEERPEQAALAAGEPVSEAEQPSLMDEQPDWLQSLKAASTEDLEPEIERQPVVGGTGPLPFVEEGLPDWMSDFKGQEASESAPSPLLPVEEYASMSAEDDQPFSVDLPDWLSEEGVANEALSEQQAEGQEGAEELAQAELPTWVSAMRPIETAIQSNAGSVDTEQYVEKAGPLSGIRGVLPADDHVISYRKPPVYSMKLRVSEKQRGHAGLLESLVGQEGQPLVLPPLKSQAPQIVLRVLVALMLVLALAGSLLASLQLLPVPTFYPPELIDLYDQIEALPVDRPVLLAVDYEPGLSGEMQFTAAMVIDHLMGRNIPLAIVSTVPTGPAMADSLMRKVQQNRAEYDLATRVENLGYLPGGTISLVEFARDPRNAAPRTADGKNAWEQGLLTDVQDIQQFASVVVITDRAEVGRDWVEQVQPYLGDVPLLMVSSAQAAPLLQPYVESKQVSGLVSGLMGGTLYGQRAGRQAANPALGHYGAYQVGALLAFMLILVGVIYSAVASMVNRKPKNRE